MVVNVYCINSSYEEKVRPIDGISPNSYTQYTDNIHGGWPLLFCALK